jgi:hypothetical protein
MGHEYDHMPFVTKILKDQLVVEEESLKLFEYNSLSDDFHTKKQADGNLSSNRSRIQDIKNALEFLKTYKKQ